jgi:hypothetical protein
MRIRDLFGLGVRLFGVWLICRGATYLATFVDLKLYPSSERVQYSATSYLIYATIDFSIAVFFLLWTRVMVAWSYGDESGSAEVESVTQGSADSKSDRLTQS